MSGAAVNDDWMEQEVKMFGVRCFKKLNENRFIKLKLELLLFRDQLLHEHCDWNEFDGFSVVDDDIAGVSRNLHSHAQFWIVMAVFEQDDAWKKIRRCRRFFRILFVGNAARQRDVVVVGIKAIICSEQSAVIANMKHGHL